MAVVERPDKLKLCGVCKVEYPCTSEYFVPHATQYIADREG